MSRVTVTPAAPPEVAAAIVAAVAALQSGGGAPPAPPPGDAWRRRARWEGLHAGAVVADRVATTREGRG